MSSGVRGRQVVVGRRCFVLSWLVAGGGIAASIRCTAAHNATEQAVLATDNHVAAKGGGLQRQGVSASG